jgi:hypothetical protein
MADSVSPDVVYVTKTNVAVPTTWAGAPPGSAVTVAANAQQRLADASPVMTSTVSPEATYATKGNVAVPGSATHTSMTGWSVLHPQVKASWWRERSNASTTASRRG